MKSIRYILGMRGRFPMNVRFSRRPTTIAILVTAAVSLTLLPVGCKGSDAVTAPSGYSISGTVTDTNGNGLTAAVRVRVDGPGLLRQVTTNTAGRYALADLPPGPVSVTALKGGYISQTLQVTIPRSLPLNFELIPLNLPYSPYVRMSR